MFGQSSDRERQKLWRCGRLYQLEGAEGQWRSESSAATDVHSGSQRGEKSRCLQARKVTRITGGSGKTDGVVVMTRPKVLS